MAGPKKFGTFAGVFTPSILTILGVIMYLRMGWVVGNAGFGMVLIIIGLAHVISITTGLSISSIATDKKVGAGGVYYVLSRSLGLPIGGALGLALFVATAFSIALYMVGFAEIFNEYINYGQIETASGIVNDTNALRITGSLGLLILTIIALISTSIALKTQFFILAAIVLSLFSIFLGDPTNVEAISTGTDAVSTPNAGFAAIFAIFFPAVTGFTAGVAMSGDLKDSKKSIPLGTMGSIFVGFIVYAALAIFLAVCFEPEVLKTNPKALFEMAWIAILVYLGVWGATLSSALGGILGGPRILQAMSIDKITPKIFAKGVGKDNEPRNALILTVIIAEAGILIGDLNVIAEVVSMFYLAAYGFINISFFLESWASADFKPTFRVRKWVGLIGFIATFAIMSQLNMMAMIAAFVIIGGIYFYLSRKQISLGTGDIWQSVWSTIVKKGLKRMEEGQDHKRNWKPNMLLFSVDHDYRSQMIEFSKAISGQNGIVTNFDLHENKEATVLFPKSKKSVQDETLEKFGVFGRQLEVQNTFKGIESIACTFGFSGVEPNTVLMGWPGETKDPVWFTEMTRKLMDLDYNVLYLDYDKRWGFRKKQTIDLWWRGLGNNAELMLMLGKYIANSPDWSRANIRIIIVNDANINYKLIETRINNLLDTFRVRAEIKVINNEVDSKPLYDLMKTYSQETDLVIVGIPEIKETEIKSFVKHTNELVSTIGTTLLVRASSHFQEADLSFEKINIDEVTSPKLEDELAPINTSFDNELSNHLIQLDQDLKKEAEEFVSEAVQPIQSFHHDLLAKVTNLMDGILIETNTIEGTEAKLEHLSNALLEINQIYSKRVIGQFQEVCEMFAKALNAYILDKENLIHNVTRKVKVNQTIDANDTLLDSSHKVRYKNAMYRVWLSEGLEESYNEFLKMGYNSLIILHQSKNVLHKAIWDLLDSDEISKSDSILDEKSTLDKAMKIVDEEALHLSETFYKSLRRTERGNINELINLLMYKDYQPRLEKRFPMASNKLIHSLRSNLNDFGSHLYRNSILFSYHLQADIYLLVFAVQINHLLEELKNSWHSELVTKFDNEIQQIEEMTDELSNIVATNNIKSLPTYQIKRSPEIFFDFSRDLNAFTKKSLAQLQTIPETIELIKAHSLNSIREVQNEAVETQEIQLQDIVEYIFQTRFMEPLSNGIQNYEGQLKRHYSALLSSTNTLQKAINEYVLTQNLEHLGDVLNEVKENIAQNKSDINGSLSGVFSELSDRKGQIRHELDINQIIEQIDLLESYARKKKATSGIMTKLKVSANFIGKTYNKAYDFIANQRKEKSSLEYVRRHSHLVSEQDVLASFIERISPNPKASYSYNQIFTDGYYLDERSFEVRSRELSMIKNGIKRIDQGTTGAILVLGPSRSGKTALVDFAVGQFIEKTPFNISIGNALNKRQNVLNEAFHRATGSSGSAKNIISNLPAGSVFIFNDIEQWAMSSKNRYDNISGIAELIKEFGRTHYFFLNGNIHGYKLLKENSNITSSIISTVILPALNQSEMIEVIQKRHFDSGLSLNIDGTPEQYAKESKVNKFIGSIISNSNGNIGMALQIWLASIHEKKDNEIIMAKTGAVEFPYIKDVDLQNLIYQLFIYRAIGKKDLINLYGEPYTMWLTRWLDALVNVNFVELTKNGNFEIVTEARPYVEKWLIELGYTA